MIAYSTFISPSNCKVTFPSQPFSLASSVPPENVSSVVLKVPRRNQNNVSFPYPDSSFQLASNSTQALTAILTLHQNPVKTQQPHSYTKHVATSWQNHFFNFFFADDFSFTQIISSIGPGSNYRKTWKFSLTDFFGCCKSTSNSRNFEFHVFALLSVGNEDDKTLDLSYTCVSPTTHFYDVSFVFFSNFYWLLVSSETSINVTVTHIYHLTYFSTRILRRMEIVKRPFQRNLLCFLLQTLAGYLLLLIPTY